MSENPSDYTRDELLALIRKSGLILTNGVKSDPKDGGHLISAGMILVHEDDEARERQRTKDLQAHANTARKLAAAERELAEVKAGGFSTALREKFTPGGEG